MHEHNPKFPLLNTTAGAIDPVCGMTVDPAKARGKAEYRDKTYYFCCPGCEVKFKADPEKYLNKAAAPAPMKVGSGMVMLGQVGSKPKLETDPVCHMQVDPVHAAGKYDYQGKTYYFCSAEDKKEFDMQPQRYIKPQMQSGQQMQHR